MQHLFVKHLPGEKNYLAQQESCTSQLDVPKFEVISKLFVQILALTIDFGQSTIFILKPYVSLLIDNNFAQ